MYKKSKLCLKKKFFIPSNTFQKIITSELLSREWDFTYRAHVSMCNIDILKTAEEISTTGKSDQRQIRGHMVQAHIDKIKNVFYWSVKDWKSDQSSTLKNPWIKSKEIPIQVVSEKKTPYMFIPSILNLLVKMYLEKKSKSGLWKTKTKSYDVVRGKNDSVNSVIIYPLCQ